MIPSPAEVPRFDRRFFEGRESFTAIGAGSLGGKAAGLHRAREILDGRPASLRFERLEISVPTLAVIGAGEFERFIERNDLAALAAAEPGDHHVARAFQRAELPAEITGDLWALVGRVHTPLAVRSSSLLEDATEHPFAGVYGTKMTPNDAHGPEARFRHLVEAVKFVWASTCFRSARAALRAAGIDPSTERMAVIVQEVVGRRHGPRFYPDVSAVARSFNFYPSGSARPEEGVANLALGLGKTIVDGGRTWSYSPAWPRAGPPFNSIDHQLDSTQPEFWAVRMGPATASDPIAEVEYLERHDLAVAERDDTLRWVASTYDPGRDRIVPGVASAGPRVLDFAPLLGLDAWPFNPAVRGLLDLFAERLGGPVEIELALTFPDEPDRPARLGFLQVRPMAVSSEIVEVPDSEQSDPHALVSSPQVLGNGRVREIRDVVFVRRDHFDPARTPAIAAEVDRFNHRLVQLGRPYLLIGFGRWGSSEPWLGIPVTWPQIAGAGAIVEAQIAGLNADPSQGAHFFHNLLGFGIPYFTVSERGGRIDWEWLESQPPVEQGEWVRRIETGAPLDLRVDGRSGRGVAGRAKEDPRG